MAKLIYALFLGVVLLTLSILDGLGSLGWWTQWLLIAAFWWIVFVQRHEVLAYARLGHAETGARGLRLAGGLLAARQLTRAVSDTARPGHRLVGRAGRTTGQAYTATRARLAEARAENAGRRRADELTRARAADHGQVERLLAGDQRSAATRASHVASVEADLGALDARRPRLAREITAARSIGDRRRALRLLDRDARLGRQVDERRAPLMRARARIARDADARDATGRAFSARDLEEHGLLLDREARKRRGVVPGPRADRDAYRDYPRLAPLADLSAESYRALPPADQRRARLTIDRELNARRGRMEARPTLTHDTEASWSFDHRASTPPRVRETPPERRRRQLGQLRDQRLP